MFICYECENVFDEPKIWVEKHGLETPPYECYAGCPSCGGAFTTAHKCDNCGEWITGSYIKLESGERICENCYTVMDLGDEN